MADEGERNLAAAGLYVLTLSSVTHPCHVVREVTPLGVKEGMT